MQPFFGGSPQQQLLAAEGAGQQSMAAGGGPAVYAGHQQQFMAASNCTAAYAGQHGLPNPPAPAAAAAEGTAYNSMAGMMAADMQRASSNSSSSSNFIMPPAAQGYYQHPYAMQGALGGTNNGVSGPVAMQGPAPPGYMGPAGFNNGLQHSTAQQGMLPYPMPQQQQLYQFSLPQQQLQQLGVHQNLMGGPQGPTALYPPLALQPHQQLLPQSYHQLPPPEIFSPPQPQPQQQQQQPQWAIQGMAGGVPPAAAGPEGLLGLQAAAGQQQQQQQQLAGGVACHETAQLAYEQALTQASNEPAVIAGHDGQQVVRETSLQQQVLEAGVLHGAVLAQQLAAAAPADQAAMLAFLKARTSYWTKDMRTLLAMLRVPYYELKWGADLEKTLEKGKPVSSTDMERYKAILLKYRAEVSDDPVSDEPSAGLSCAQLLPPHEMRYFAPKAVYLAAITAADEGAMLRDSGATFCSFQASFGSGRRRKLSIGLHQIHPRALHLHPRLAKHLPADPSLELLSQDTRKLTPSCCERNRVPALVAPYNEPSNKGSGRPNSLDTDVAIEAYELKVNDECAAMAEGWVLGKTLCQMLRSNEHLSDDEKPVQWQEQLGQQLPGEGGDDQQPWKLRRPQQQWRPEQQPERVWPTEEEHKVQRQQWRKERLAREQERETQRQILQQKVLEREQRQQAQQQKQQQKKGGKRRSGGVEQELQAKRHKVRLA
jgi:hypothetical protein